MNKITNSMVLAFFLSSLIFVLSGNEAHALRENLHLIPFSKKSEKVVNSAFSVNVDGSRLRTGEYVYFGPIEHKSTSGTRKTITVRNDSRVRQLISSLSISAPGYKIVESPKFPLSLRSGAAIRFVIEVDTSQIGYFEAQLKIDLRGPSVRSILLKAVVEASPPGPVLTNGYFPSDLDGYRVAHYQFEGNTLDVSANDNDLISANGPAIETLSTGNRVATFDGLNDYLFLPNIIRFKVTPSVSLSLWIKKENPGKDAALISLLGDGGTLTTDGDSAIYQCRHSLNPNDFDVGQLSAGNFADAEWHHVAISYDELGGAQSYFDGQLVDSTSRASLLMREESLLIGAASLTSTLQLFKGKIDELALFNRSLTTDEAAEIYLSQAHLFGVSTLVP